MNWIYIVIKDVKCMLREKIAWLTMILLPLVVIIVAGFSLTGIFGTKSPDMILAYYYQGDVEQIEPFLHSIQELNTISLKTADSKEDGIDMIENSKATAFIIIPDNFDVSDTKLKSNIQYYYDISNQSTADIMHGMITGTVNSLNNSVSCVSLP